MNKRAKTSILAVFCFICAIIITLLLLKKPEGILKEQNTQSISYVKEGKIISQKYCSSCHTFPDPNLLPKRTWKEETLPHMGPQLGIFEHNGNIYPIERTKNLPDSYYPAEQQLNNEEWQKIIDYYVTSAPENLQPKKNIPPITTDSIFFKSHQPAFRERMPPNVSSIRFDPENRVIYLSDASRSMFYIFDADLTFKDRYNLSSAISDIQLANDIASTGSRELLTTYIGSVNPTDAPTGFVQMVSYEPTSEQGSAGNILVDNLVRPVESKFVDLNQDGNRDLLVNEFGHRTGGLFWLSNIDKKSDPDKHILVNTPGCIQSHVLDYTGNGLPDIFTLCTQTDQSLYLFKNQGDGVFKQKQLIQFEVTAGSSSFELHDFNKDGHLDILYTSGDNADYSITYKSYHGVYIYLNDGNNKFTEEWFYPMNGAYDATARDFDKDDYLDIAAISFFANYEEKPEEGFIYFKGKEDLTFTPYHHPATSLGRWIAMDVTDWNKDGYEDIILGNFSQGPTKVAHNIQNEWMQGPHFILLENLSRIKN